MADQHGTRKDIALRIQEYILRLHLKLFVSFQVNQTYCPYLQNVSKIECCFVDYSTTMWHTWLIFPGTHLHTIQLLCQV